MLYPFCSLRKGVVSVGLELEFVIEEDTKELCGARGCNCACSEIEVGSKVIGAESRVEVEGSEFGKREEGVARS